jgi:histidine ammonia-lyase
MGEQLMTIVLNGSDLTVTQVVAAARHGEPVMLAPEALSSMAKSRTVVEEVLSGGEPVYGLTTGVGERKAFLLDPADRQRFNQRLVLNHRIAQGEPAPSDVVRGAMICLANSYAKGVTGVRPELAQMIVTQLNEGFAPPVRTLGSVGQGDLGPMADLAHGLLTRSGYQVAENEGLALVSSNAFTTAWACIATADAEALMSVFDVAGALDLEAFGANLTCLHPIIEQIRPFPGLAETLHRLRLLLAGSYLWQPGAARFLQDPLTFRCLPHINGTARDALAYTGGILQLELNSSQSNPVVVPARNEPGSRNEQGSEPGNEHGRIVSVGNFDIGPLAAALDFARIALAPVVTSANERMVKLLQAPFSGLPAGLAALAGSPEDALSELAVAGQAITVEARTLAHPVSYELASSVKGDGIEDRATMAPLSARRLADMIGLCARVAAIELVVAAQAIDLRALDGPDGRGELGLGTGRAYRMIRELVPFTAADGTLPADLEPVVDLVSRGGLTAAA